MKTLIRLLILTALPLVHATIIQMDFRDGTTGEAGTVTLEGTTWNRLVSKSSPTPNTDPDLANLKSSANENTGISFAWGATGFSFATNSRGESGTAAGGVSTDGLSTYTPIGVDGGVTLASTGHFLPWAVLDGYNANNIANNVITFTLSSDTANFFKFTFASSRDDGTGNGATSYNIGGTYNTTTKAFEGGSTLTLDAFTSQGTSLNYALGQLTTGTQGFLASYNELTSKYELTVQVAKFGTPGGSSAAYLNGLVMETVAIPEPGTLALLGIALGSLLLFRRRK